MHDIGRGQGRADPVDICVITTIHPPYEARIYERGIKPFAQAGFSVALVSGWPVPSTDPYVRNWITVRGAQSRAGRLAAGFRIFRGALRQKARLYYFHDLDFIGWAGLLSLVTRRAVIYDCHENYALEVLHGKPWIRKPLRRPLAFLTALVESLCVRVIGNCVVPVEGMDERFRRLGAETAVVRNLADWTPRRDLAHARGLVCSGTIAPNFGAYVLIGIARELKRRGSDLPLVLTLRGASDEMKGFIREAVEVEKLNIRMLPPVLPSEIDKVLSQGSIGLSVYVDSPDKRLAVPSKLFEYMAMGLPVVATDLPLKRKIIMESGCGVLVKSNTPEEFTDAVLQLLNDPRSFAQYRENGFRAIESLYAWRREKEVLIRFVKGVMSSRVRRAEMAA